MNPFLLSKRLFLVNRTLLVKGGTFLFSSILQRAAGFLMVPVLIATASPDLFTRYGLLVSAFAILVPLFSLNVHLAPQRLYYDYQHRREQASFLATTLMASVGFTGIGLLLLLAFSPLLIPGDPLTTGRFDFKVGLALVVVMMVAVQFSTMLARVKGRANTYALLTGAQGVGLLLAFLALYTIRAADFQSLLLAFLAANLLAAFIGLRYAAPHLREARLSAALLKQAVAFSWPTSIHLLALWGITYSGRWIGTQFMSLEALAPFILVTTIANAAAMLPRALYDARMPDIGTAFAQGRRRDGARLIRSITYTSLGLLALVYGGLFVLLYGVGLDLPPAYRPTLSLLLLAALASMFDTVYLQGVQVLVALKKTGTQAAATVFSGLLTIVLSFVLARSYGDLGLIAAVVAGFAVQAAVSCLLAQRRLRDANAT